MAYVTYTTEALVCGTFKRNTSDSSYLLFTREVGMLYADARSVRVEKSRQRYALQDFSLVRVSLVRGKQSWKVGSIQANKNYYHQAIDKTARGSVVSVFRLLRRFVKGEEAMTELFDLSIQSLDALVVDAKERLFVEEVIKLRLLELLGYVDAKKLPDFVIETPVNKAHEFADDALEQKISNIYSHAVDISHL